MGAPCAQEDRLPPGRISACADVLHSGSVVAQVQIRELGRISRTEPILSGEVTGPQKVPGQVRANCPGNCGGYWTNDVPVYVVYEG